MNMSARTDREPDYNQKRRAGIKALHLDTCSACGYRIPESRDADIGRTIPCSDFHERCVRCHWPVAKTLLTENRLCSNCLPNIERRRYNRLTKAEAL